LANKYDDYDDVHAVHDAKCNCSQDVQVI